jgi:hypothetical protein
VGEAFERPPRWLAEKTSRRKPKRKKFFGSFFQERTYFFKMSKNIYQIKLNCTQEAYGEYRIDGHDPVRP